MCPLFTYLSFNISFFQSIYLSNYLCIYLSICLQSFCHLFIYPSNYLHIYLCIKYISVNMHLEIPGPWSRCLLPRWWEFAHSRHGPCSRRRSLQSCPRCPSEKMCVIKCVRVSCFHTAILRARQTWSMVPRRHVFWACWNRVFRWAVW